MMRFGVTCPGACQAPALRGLLITARWVASMNTDWLRSKFCVLWKGLLAQPDSSNAVLASKTAIGPCWRSFRVTEQILETGSPLKVELAGIELNREKAKRWRKSANVASLDEQSRGMRRPFPLPSKLFFLIIITQMELNKRLPRCQGKVQDDHERDSDDSHSISSVRGRWRTR
jgi:hypothetical protein